MNPNDESRLAEHRHAFLRQLPRRVETIGRRLLRFMQDGWDINGLALIHEDAVKLGAGCERHGLEAAGGHFRQMFIISHVEDVQQSPVMNEAWTITERDGSSRVERPSFLGAPMAAD